MKSKDFKTEFKKVFYGTVINPISDKKCEYYPDGAMVLSFDKRKNKWMVAELGDRQKLAKKIEAYPMADVFDYEGHILMPAFFDMHFHWVQDDVREMPKANLLKWLENYTFPTENSFSDENYAEQRALEFKGRLLSVGTLGGLCYSSIHAHALESALKHFVGDFSIGNVLMDMNSPSFLLQDSKQALQEVKKLSKKYKERYTFTPRFAPTTSPGLMTDGGKEIKKNKSFIQTHLSETTNEIEWVLGLYKEQKGFEKIKSYTEIYHKCGILGPRTVMGHCIHMSKNELDLMSKTKTAIAHCPTSNAPIRQKGLGSGLMDFKKVERHKIRWALATDIGGGPFLSMFDVMQSFVSQHQKEGRKEATYTKALFRSTLAGAEIMQKDKQTGNIAKGKEGSFIAVPFKGKAPQSAEELLKKVVAAKARARGDYDSLVAATYYGGECLYER